MVIYVEIGVCREFSCEEGSNTNAPSYKNLRNISQIQSADVLPWHCLRDIDDAFCEASDTAILYPARGTFEKAVLIAPSFEGNGGSIVMYAEDAAL